MSNAKKRSILVWLVLVASGLAIWALTTQAQVIDADPCERACHQQHMACIDVCGQGDNPVECEASCDDQQEECVSQCR